MKFRGIIPALFLCAISCTPAAYEFEELYKDLPFDMPRVYRPEIKDTRVSLSDFGGVPDGVTLNTEAFASAIEALSERGGGHLDVPDGIWLSGPISFRSGIDLHLSEGALVVFSDDPSLYPVKDLNFEGLDTRRCQSLIEAFDCHDISITGAGVIEGSGDTWRELRRDKVNPVIWRKALESGRGVLSDDGSRLYPDEGFKLAATSPHTFNVPTVALDEEVIKRFLRPVLIGFQNCENVLLEGCTFQNSPSWNLHPVFCKNLIVKDIFVKAPDYSQNGDGIDIDACENTIVVDSSFDVGDDAVCVKSGKNEDGRRRGIPTKNLIVSGCTVYHGHGGFVVGSEMSGGVCNVKVSRCRYLGTELGLRFKSCRGRGGVVENIWIEDILMKDIMSDAIIFNLIYNGTSAFSRISNGESGFAGLEPMPVDETTPEFRNINIKGVNCSGAESAMNFFGLPEKPVKGISVSDSHFCTKKGASFAYSRDIVLSNVSIDNSEGEKISAFDTENLRCDE